MPLVEKKMQSSRPSRNIAAACAFLASDDADYITGHTLSVNGRRYASRYSN